MAMFGAKRVTVDRLPQPVDPNDPSQVKAALIATREKIRQAVPEGYEILAIEEHVVHTIESVARHSNLELAGAFRETSRTTRSAIITLVRKGMRYGGRK